MDRKRLTQLVGAAAVAVVLCSACGSSSKTSTATKKTTTSTSTTAKSSSSDNSDNSSSSNDTSGSSGVAGALTIEQCSKAADAYLQVLAVPGGLMSGQSKSLKDVQSQINSLNADIPDSLKDDYKTVANAYAKYAADLKDIDFSKTSSLLNPDNLKKLQAAGKELDASSFKSASDRISKYFDDGCK